MTSQANARAHHPQGPLYRRLIERFASLDDGNILRVAFFALLAGTAALLFVDYRELAAIEGSSLAMPLQPILPPAQAGPYSGPAPQVTTAPALLEQPLDIALGSGGQLALTGTIDPGAAERFASEIAARGEYVRSVVLDSPGGSVHDALAIANLIDERGLDTQVLSGGFCASSCPIIFASGKARIAGPDTSIGVHQIYAASLASNHRGAVLTAGLATSLTMSDAQATTARIITGLTHGGVGPELWLHALETPPEQLYYFSRDEMLSLKLVTEFMQK